MYGCPESNDYRFAPNLIGEALSYIVTEFEGENYVYDSIEVYEHGWRQGMGIYINTYDTKAIVKQGFSKCRFCLNSDSPWILTKLAHVLECTRHWPSNTVDYDLPVSFAEEFNSPDCVFPYLNDFLNILEEIRKSNGDLTKAKIMQLANDYVEQTKALEKRKVSKIKGLTPFL